MFTKNIGFTPNMMATFALSPIAFNSWATLLGSLSKALDVRRVTASASLSPK
jgi:hypothetical protein